MLFSSSTDPHWTSEFLFSQAPLVYSQSPPCILWLHLTPSLSWVVESFWRLYWDWQCFHAVPRTPILTRCHPREVCSSITRVTLESLDCRFCKKMGETSDFRMVRTNVVSSGCVSHFIICSSSLARDSTLYFFSDGDEHCVICAVVSASLWQRGQCGEGLKLSVYWRDCVGVQRMMYLVRVARRFHDRDLL